MIIAIDGFAASGKYSGTERLNFGLLDTDFSTGPSAWGFFAAAANPTTVRGVGGGHRLDPGDLEADDLRATRRRSRLRLPPSRRFGRSF